MKFGFENMFGGKSKEKEEKVKTTEETEELESFRESIKKIEAIREVETFEELYAVLDEIGEIKGSEEVHTSAYLKDTIDLVRNGEESLRFITNTYNLRDKVEELLEKEGNEKYKEFEKK